MPAPSNSTGGTPAAFTSITDCTGSKGIAGQILSSTGTALQWILDCRGTVTSVSTGTGLTGGPITATGTIALANTAVASGSYTYGSFTVDSQGRLTAASSGVNPVTSVTAGTGLSGGTITSTGTIALANTAVTAGSYTNTSITVDAQGRLTAASSGTAPVTAVTGTAPIAVTSGTTPVVSIASSSTTALGAVQLSSALNSTSETLALTAGAGKCLQDQITTLLVAPGIEFAGTVDATTGFVLSITTVGSAAGYTVGAVLPNASATTANTYVIVTTPGTFTPPGGVSTVATDGDWFLVSQTTPGVYAWNFLNVGFDAPVATTSVAGIVCLSTNALAQAGTDATTALTPAAGASAYVAKSALSAKGVILGASAACTPSALTVGTDGQMLVACSTTTTGLCWINQPAAAIPCATVTGKGAIVTGTAASTPTALTVGTDGQVLSACSTAATGLCWTTPAATPAATPTVAGIVLGRTNATNATLGCNAGLSLTSATGNVAIGLNAGCSNLTGVNNVFIGNSAGLSNLGAGNVGVGTCALGCNTVPSRNTAVGEGAAALNTSGEYITAIGWGALCASTTASSNVALGALAGKNITTGQFNVVIGGSVNAPVATGSCQLAIGYNETFCWLTGCSDLSIKPGAGIRDCGGSAGTAGQVLMSNGSNAICWGTPAASGVTSFSGGTTGLTPVSAATGAVTLAGTLAIANGGTGATTASAALTALGAMPLAGGTFTGPVVFQAGQTFPNPSGTTPPATPATGNLWYDTTAPATLKVYNGTAWVPTAAAASSNTAPASPTTGTTWYDTSVTPALLKVWNGSAWVSVPDVATSTPPTSPTTGQLWNDTSTTPPTLKTWNGTAWVASGSPTASNTAPTSPTTGQLWNDTSTTPPTLKTWNGSAWVASGGPTASNTAPTSPTTGQLWNDTNSTPAVLKTWSGSAWVPQSTSVGTTAPTSPVLGQLWNDTNSTPAVAKVWNGTSWVPQSTTVGTTAPSDPVVGQLWSDTRSTPAIARVWDGSFWIPQSTTVSTTAPSSPGVGQLWNDISSTPAVAKVWSGTAWVPQSTTVGTTAPSGPVLGQLWSDTNSTPAVAKVWNGTSWVPQSTTVGTTAPSGPVTGQLWNDTNTTPATLKTWNGTAWVASDATLPATPTAFGTIKGTTNNTCGNLAVGCNSFNLTATGVNNTSLGTNSLTSATTGLRNTAVGGDSMCRLTTGGENTVVGWAAGRAITTGCCNSLFGMSAAFQGTGNLNTALGYAAGVDLLAGSNNVLIGYNTGGVSNGDCNVAIGNRVAVASQTGSCQLAIGFSPTDNWLIGTSTKAIKPGAGIIDCANSCGTAGQVLLSTGANAVCWGAPAKATPTTLGTMYGYVASVGDSVGLGRCVFECLNPSTFLGGNTNTAIGFYSQGRVVRADCNTSVGYSSLLHATSSSNTAIGFTASDGLTTGGSNTTVGSSVSRRNTTGSCNTYMGFQTAFARVTGDNNVAIGVEADCTSTAGSQNVAIGPKVQLASTTGSCQLAIGFSTTENWLTGTSTKAIKPGAGIIDCANSCGTAGQVLMSNGANAVCWGTAGGGGASPATPTVAGIVLGVTNATNVGLGCNALLSNTGTNNTALGLNAGCAITTGTCNVVIGNGVQVATPTGSCQLSIGFSATGNWLTGCSDKTIRPGAGIRDCTDSVGTPVSISAGSVLMSAGAAGVVWCALPTAMSNYSATVFGCTNSVATALGSSSTGIAYAFGNPLYNQDNVSIGRNIAAAVSYVNGSIFIGSCILSVGGGGQCRDSVVIGTCASQNALNQISTSNVVIGKSTGCCHVGSCNTFVGACVATTCISGTNITAIGFNAQPSAFSPSNEITLGNSSVTTIRAAVPNITSLSDARDKTDITALPVGLDFVNSLNPVKFTWQMREPNEVKDGTSEAGFIAQDLQVAQDAANADYLGLVYNQDPERLEASAGKLLPVLVKAIQELSAQNKALEDRIAQLEANG